MSPLPTSRKPMSFYLRESRSWVTPLWMQHISSVVFTTWAMQGLNDLMLRDRGLGALPWTGSVLLANGVAFTALGLALFRARHSAR